MQVYIEVLCNHHKPRFQKTADLWKIDIVLELSGPTVPVQIGIYFHQEILDILNYKIC